MSLTTCPECGLQISDKAITCPHCGYPLEADIHQIIDKELPAQMKYKLKNMFDKMLDYAMEYEIIDHNVSRTFKLPKNIASASAMVQHPHVALSPEELDRSWALQDEPFVDMMLIQCYTRLRPQELFNIRNEDIHFEQGYFTGGLKTAADKNHIIPIHEKIKPRVSTESYSSSSPHFSFHLYLPEPKSFLHSS